MNCHIFVIMMLRCSYKLKEVSPDWQGIPVQSPIQRSVLQHSLAPNNSEQCAISWWTWWSVHPQRQLTFSSGGWWGMKHCITQCSKFLQHTTLNALPSAFGYLAFTSTAQKSWRLGNFFWLVYVSLFIQVNWSLVVIIQIHRTTECQRLLLCFCLDNRRHWNLLSTDLKLNYSLSITHTHTPNEHKINPSHSRMLHKWPDNCFWFD